MEPAALVANRTFDEIRVGDTERLSRTISKSDIDIYGAVSGGSNPVESEADPQRGARFEGIAAHSILTAGMISNLLGTRLPGPGTIYVGQNLRFERSVLAGDTVEVSITAREKRPADHSVLFDCCCVNQNGDTVLSGTAEVIAPIRKERAAAREVPELHVRSHAKYDRLIARTEEIAAIPTIVAHPCDESSLQGAVDAAEAGIIVPILVGPEQKIRAAAERLGIDLARYEIVPAEHSHAAAAKAVQLVKAGKGDLLMKGSLHTDELLREVTARETGLRTVRRVSHVFIMDVPTYPEPLFVTDAAVNIAPDLEAKVDIVQNAIDLHVGLGLGPPRVAILSAVETVTTKIPGTIEAAALCKMADRGQIDGGILDGPLALDNAISPDAVRIKGIRSDVAGRAQILLVPDLEAGNMLAKNLTFLANADAAGIVLGARVPIILTSRADSVRARMASCAVAALYAHARRASAPPIAA